MSSGLPTELYLEIFDRLASPAFQRSCPQPSEIRASLRALCLASSELYQLSSTYLYDCIMIESPHQLHALVNHGLTKPRRIRTVVYTGHLRIGAFPIKSLRLLIQRVSPTVERLMLNLNMGMPLAVYSNPIIELREIASGAPRLVEFGAFSSAGDEMIFPYMRHGKSLYPLLAWPTIRRVALLSIFMASSFAFDVALPSVQFIALPCQVMDEWSVTHLDTIIQGWTEPKKLVWACPSDDEEDTLAWYTFNFLPQADGIARRNRERVEMVCVHAPVTRAGLGRWMQERMLDGSLWSMDGQTLGKGTNLRSKD